jgi:ADP-ribosylglycohydrolase
LAESVANGYDLKDVATNFVKWRNEAFWTAHNQVFDIGITTSIAIERLSTIISVGNVSDLSILKHSAVESDNGNGSLMRILPLILVIQHKELKTQFELVWENSALTHRHIRAAMSCMIYLKLAEFILARFDKFTAYQKTKDEILKLWQIIDFPEAEKRYFERVIQFDINLVNSESIRSGGYVIDTLEASLWSFFTTETFEDAVLKSINLGSDTDTTGAVTGGIAGLYYGWEKIPASWIESLARVNDVVELAQRLDCKYKK